MWWRLDSVTGWPSPVSCHVDHVVLPGQHLDVAVLVHDASVHRVVVALQAFKSNVIVKGPLYVQKTFFFYRILLEVGFLEPVSGVEEVGHDSGWRRHLAHDPAQLAAISLGAVLAEDVNWKAPAKPVFSAKREQRQERHAFHTDH